MLVDGEPTRTEYEKTLFSRPGRVQLVAWLLLDIDPGGHFYQEQARKAIGAVSNEIAQNIHALERLGMIRRASGGAESARRHYYVRLPSPLWDVYLLGIEALDSLFGRATSEAKASPGTS